MRNWTFVPGMCAGELGADRRLRKHSSTKLSRGQRPQGSLSQSSRRWSVSKQLGYPLLSDELSATTGQWIRP